MKEIKISKNIEWIRPYLDIVSKDLSLNISKLTKIKGTKQISLNRVQSAIGYCYEFYDRYEIELFLSYHKKTRPMGDLRVVEIAPLSKLDIVKTLAHELAHIITDFEHSPNHQIMECIITMSFMEQMKEEGYISEEHEAENT